MSKKKSPSLSRLFFRGLGIVLPLVLTVGFLVWLWNFLSGKVFKHVDAGLVWILGLFNQSDALSEPIRLGCSVAIIVILLFLVGWWFSGFLGRRAVAAFERGLARIPLIGAIYPYVKQVTEFFFGEEHKVEFDRVVSVPYPRPGVYSLGFLTGNCMRSLNKARGAELISVFVPSSPMPATGYTLFVPAADIIPLDLSVEEALRVVISGGVLIPPQEMEAPSSLSGHLAKSAATQDPNSEIPS